MPLTALDPSTALIVIDRQKGIVDGHSRRGTSFGEGWTGLLPELDRQPGDIVVTKRSWGAFATTGLERLLRARGVTQVVVTGVATGGGSTKEIISLLLEERNAAS